MKKLNIIFDLDDTLIHCNKYFNFVLDQFSMQMRDWFKLYSLTNEEIKQKQEQIDIAGVDQFGFKLDRFPHSLIQTYRYFSARYQRLTIKSEEELLVNLGYSIYDYLPEPYPDMTETLSELVDSGHRLFLYTAGDSNQQLKKIRHVKLEHFFVDRIYVTLHKNNQTMEDFLATHELERHKTWMIGNSMKTDIIPAIYAGIHSIFIPAAQEWSYNYAQLDIEPIRSFHQVSYLMEVPHIIRSQQIRDN